VAENKIGIFLSEKNIKYIKQFYKEKFSYDYYLVDYKIILEYNGTYWHCDPRLYEANFYHTRRKMTAQEMWDYDKKRMEVAKKYANDVIVVWESDVVKMTDVEFKQFIYDAIENKINTKG
jgi:G:T-mismatch repair DNA endonuclease (very short patch repair protein)